MNSIISIPADVNANKSKTGMWKKPNFMCQPMELTVYDFYIHLFRFSANNCTANLIKITQLVGKLSVKNQLLPLLQEITETAV